MFFHPSQRDLGDFADGSLDAAATRRVSAHVARCARCRATVWHIRAVDAAAGELGTPAPAPDLLERVLARRAAGEEVILPAACEPPAARGSGRARGWAVAAAVVLVVGAAAVWLGTPEALADASELHIMPERPRAGDTVRVEYRPSTLLARQPELVLRARLRRPHDGSSGWENAVLARLTPRGRGYTGAFVLPDSVVYAVFAVEDTAATEVDANGEAWDLLIHRADGTPLLDALEQRYRDALGRETRIAAETAERMLELYPTASSVWYKTYIAATTEAGQAQRDSIARAHRTLLPERLAHVDTTDATQLMNVVFYAGGIEDTATANLYRRRLIRDFPNTHAAIQQRVFEALALRTDRERFWVALEELWHEDSPNAQLLFSAFQQAQSWRDTARIHLWGERVVRSGVLDRGFVIPAYIANAPLRRAGMDHIRALLRELDDMPDDARQITETRARHRARFDQIAARQLAELGALLAEDGHEAAALDTLSRAAGAVWHPPLFRQLADTRLRMGDTAAALPLFARVAADPLTPPAFEDSLRARFASIDGARWQQWRKEAEQEMSRHLMVQAVSRPVSARFRLTDNDGRSRTISPANETETFIAIWSRYCPPSLQQLPQLDRVIHDLEAQGVRVITIAEEDPGPGLAEFMAGRKLSFGYYYDVDREARRALASAATPTYLLLDTSGRVRFRSWSLDDALRQVWLLQRQRAT